MQRSIDLRIYLRETNGTNFLSEELFGASVLLDYSGLPQVVGVLSAADITPNTGFTDLTPPPTATLNQAGFTGSVGLDPLLSADTGPRILLGTFRLKGLAAGTTTLVATDRDLLSADTITGLGTELDALIASGTASITVNVSAVPEPSTAISVSLLGIALLISHTVRRAWARQLD